jgi:acyl-CoA reductase-like NAD-dependent aldehyde dehydrogenase
MSNTLQTISPVDGRVYVERELASPKQIDRTLDAAARASKLWSRRPLEERVSLLGKAIDAFVAQAQPIAEELTWQMGRPISQTPGEVRGFEERARYMLGIAAEALAPVNPGDKPGFERYIQRVPLGVVAVIAPWNYPYLTAVNAILPALAAGNTVILKHSHQTPLCAERFDAAFRTADLPSGVFQYLHVSHENAARLMADSRVNFVAFTGSVAGGHSVQRALVKGFAGCGLELGGKDPAYVRADADLRHAVETVTDGAFFNSGQSCCGIERVYVHESLYDNFVGGMVDLASGYVLGNPTDPAVNLGPMVRAAAADAVSAQIDEAVKQGARAHIDPMRFKAHARGTPYLAPQVLTDVDHRMKIMTEETFGPAVGVMKVSSDEQAIDLMNDSQYGLTAAIFTRDVAAARRIGDALDTGTVFMNRCDYLDPALAWTGVKSTGRGCSLSKLGYEYLTRPKSYHLKVKL